MSYLSVAKKDFLDVRRAKMIWFVGGAYTLLIGLLFYAENRGSADMTNALQGMIGIGALVIPLIALVAAYLSIAGERESGTIRYHLSLPTSRLEFLLGKFISRAAVVTSAVVFAFGVALLLGFLWFPSLELNNFVRVLMLTTVFALTFVSVAVGVSAMTSSRSRAIGAAIGIYFVTVVFQIVPMIRIRNILEIVLNDILGLSVGADPLFLIQALTSPFMAFALTWGWAFPDEGQPFGVEAWYLQPKVTIFILLAWLVVPLVLGYLKLERSDLG